MPSKPSSFGIYLRSTRCAAGLSLRHVADSIGVSHVYVGEVERGVRGPMKPEKWLLLAKVVPGFSAAHAGRLVASEQPVQLHLQDAPPQYQDLGVALARRIESRDIAPSDMNQIRRILGLGEPDD